MSGDPVVTCGSRVREIGSLIHHQRSYPAPWPIMLLTDATASMLAYFSRSKRQISAYTNSIAVLTRSRFIALAVSRKAPRYGQIAPQVGHLRHTDFSETEIGLEKSVDYCLHGYSQRCSAQPYNYLRISHERYRVVDTRHETRRSDRGFPSSVIRPVLFGGSHDNLHRHWNRRHRVWDPAH